MSEATLTTAPPRKRHGYWRLVWHQFRKNKLAMTGFVLVCLMGLLAVFAPVLANDIPLYMVKDGKTYVLPVYFQSRYPDLIKQRFYQNASYWKPADDEYALRPLVPYSPLNQIVPDKKAAPSAKHWLGADDRGRDVLARLIWGARISLSIGFIAVGISIVIGVILGALAGYYGGIVDVIVLRIIEVFLCFPSFFLILAAIAFLPPSIYNIMIVLGFLGWTSIARLVRGEFLKLRDSEFALAARASGLRDTRVIFRHLLPNALAPVLVSATFGVAGAILTESSLSFLGLGVSPPTATWGELLDQSRPLVASGVWWLVVFPGLAIFVTVCAFNLVGEGLRDAMDPRLRQ